MSDVTNPSWIVARFGSEFADELCYLVLAIAEDNHRFAWFGAFQRSGYRSEFIQYNFGIACMRMRKNCRFN